MHAEAVWFVRKRRSASSSFGEKPLETDINWLVRDILGKDPSSSDWRLANLEERS